MGSEGKYTPGPWHLCNDGRCSCLTISCSDHPIANAVKGKWGDDYPTIKIEGPSLDAKAVAVMEQITYGDIPKDVALANARLIATAPELLEPFRAADEQDWEWLFDRLGDSGHGRFWKTIFTELRRAITKATGGDHA